MKFKEIIENLGEPDVGMPGCPDVYCPKCKKLLGQAIEWEAQYAENEGKTLHKNEKYKVWCEHCEKYFQMKAQHTSRRGDFKYD